MPPEEPGQLIALELRMIDDVLVAEGEMVVPRDQNLRVSWYAHNVPQNYRPICGGVAHAFEDSIAYVQPLPEMRPTRRGEKYSWREPMRKDGIMFILILPEQKTISQPIPLPIEAKVFNNKIALFWLAWADDSGNRAVTFEWELETIKKQVELEVDDINSFISKSTPRPAETEFDVALSYASEDREYVNTVAGVLQQRGVKVFYDQYETATLWGKNLYDHLRSVYGEKSRYTVMFISESYKNKNWTNFERETAQARAFADNREYILPVRFDDTKLPGMLDTTAYVSAQQLSPTELAELIIKKLATS
jgi:hypothetical protein